MAHGKQRTTAPQSFRYAGIELSIGELTLSGFAPGDRGRIHTAIEAELTRLFTEHGVSPSLAQGDSAASLDGGTFHVVPGSGARAIGVQIAQAIYGGKP